MKCILIKEHISLPLTKDFLKNSPYFRTNVAKSYKIVVVIYLNLLGILKLIKKVV